MKKPKVFMQALCLLTLMIVPTVVQAKDGDVIERGHEVELEDEHHRNGDDGNSSDDSADDSDDRSNDRAGDDSSTHDGNSGRKGRKKRKGGSKNDSKRSAQSGESIKLRTSLSAIEGVPTRAFGKVVYRRRVRSDRSEARLQSKVYIPVPSEVPSLENESDVRTKEISVVIQSADAVIALCTYRFDNFRRLDSGNVIAGFKLDVVSKTRDGGDDRTTEKHGFCDIDPNSEGVQIGVPTLDSGDLLVVHDGEVRFLTGTL